MTRQALIVGAAPRPDAGGFYRDLLTRFDVVLACDGAAEWAVARGRVPDYAIGDFDSAEPGAQQRLRAAGATVLEFPRQKDQTDLDLAAAHAAVLGTSELVFTAAFSGRLDHTLAAIGTMRRHARLLPVVLEPDFTGWLLAPKGRAELSFEAPAGAVFSVVAIEEISGLHVSGARYDTHERAVEVLSGQTVSNECLGDTVNIRLAGGSALVLLMHSLHNGL
ncbi:thiamine pyrophosphokinase [Coriobacteriaceae bacterium EMTCatB1]|nr:thiamine pyrophosphokinase [Coriobacteriaceae bacterium EMTCatB1]